MTVEEGEQITGDTSGEEVELNSGLVEESDVPSETPTGGDSFDRQLEETLRETEEAVLGLQEMSADPDQAKSWAIAGDIVKRFRPVPWFIWRLSNFVLGRPGAIGEVSEGLVFGLRRLMFALASDQTLGEGEKVKSVRKAIQIVPSDVIASASVIHAICRRLASKEHERIWKPILDDAILRARIGYEVGSRSPEFGAGRGMLSGFAGRSGLAVLISLGEIDSARKSLELLATGRSIKEAGLVVYECDPLQVSAMMLTAAGIGRDAAFGTVNFSFGGDVEALSSIEQKRWLSAFQIIESVRIGATEDIQEESWKILGFDETAKSELRDTVKKLVRRGHGWQWLV